MYAILIPAFNEENKIEQVVKESLRLTKTVLVVDDGSFDQTAFIARKAGADVVQNHVNLGLGGALHNGLIALFEKNIKTVVTIDGDGAHNCSLIPSMVDFHLAEQADITIGSRLLTSERENDFPCPKRSANKLGAILLNHFCNINLSDVASGMRVVNSKYIHLSQLSSGYGFTFDLICLAANQGFRLKDFPIDVKYDARQFFATRSSEIIGLLQSIIKFANDRYKDDIFQIIDKIQHFERFHLKIKDKTFYLFPIREYASYMIQEQHSNFEKSNSYVDFTINTF